jgi:hypothetical protein
LNGLQTFIFAKLPAITYTKCCMLGFIHFQLVNKLFSLIFSLNRSTNVSEKIVFRGGKKAVAGRQALLQFGIALWLV